MKFKLSWLLPVLLLASTSVFAQTETVFQPTATLLHNNDVLRMVSTGMKPGEIIAKIVTSNCAFDIFPPVMRDLKRRGVPDTVLMAMRMVPYGPPAMAVAPKAAVPPDMGRVRIPLGTVIGVEPTKALSSADVANGNAITFLVSRRVLVNGVLVINRGAVARGRVTKSKRAGFWGRPGKLDFAMEDVLAVDGTRIPIQLSDGVKGTNYTSAVTAAAIVTGAIVFPYTSPVALFWGLKKGDDAVLDQGTKLAAVVKNNQEVAGWLPELRIPIYHSVAALNRESEATGLSHPFNFSFRPTPISQR
jgi:hypothetical protein